MIFEAARWVVVACSALAILVGTPQWRRWFRQYPPEIVQGRLALAALNIAAGYGTVEALHRGVPPGPRTLVLALGAVWALYAVAWQPVADLHHRLNRRTHALPAPGALPHPRDRGRC